MWMADDALFVFFFIARAEFTEYPVFKNPATDTKVNVLKDEEFGIYWQRYKERVKMLILTLIEISCYFECYLISYE